MTNGWGSGNDGGGNTAKTPTNEQPSEKAERLPNGQFPPKKSGNPRGRPRKRERSHTERQFRRDVFAEFERNLTIDGKKLPAIRFVLRRVIHEAANGNKTAMKMAVDMYKLAVTENETANPESTALLETFEQKPEVSDKDPTVNRILNGMRVKTRDL